MDTIFAEATPPGKGGVSIVRLSGPRAFEIAASLGARVEPRKPALRELTDAGDVIDRALVLGFAEGESFTGEAVVEFHLHGAPVIVRRLSAALAAAGARPAGAGEFTRRAFAAGRLDLTEVQGLSDLLVAETEAQRQLAMRNSSGELGQLVDGWRSALIRAGALIAASLDFPDEGTPEDVPTEVSALIAGVAGEIAEAIRGTAAAEIVRNGFTIAVVGPPNAGKSSLINRIAQRDVALVTPIPGTTRDALEVRVELAGLAVTLVDTAGLRDTDDPVEQLGVERARQRAQDADLRLHLAEDGTARDELWREGDLVQRTKIDLTGLEGVSALTGAGIGALIERIGETLRQRVAGAGVVSHRMQADQLQTALGALDYLPGAGGEVLAEHLREALRALEGLIGRVDIEDYLDLVFSTFCIGK